MKEQLTNILSELREINTENDVSNQGVDALIEELEGAKVCVPVIGRFSSGKSALINQLLRYRQPILRENITRETAIPAEIEYTSGEEKTVIYHMNGTETVLRESYIHYIPNSEEDSHAKLCLNNEDFLAEIPDVMIVDMPGFESGYDVHDKAIDSYITRSMAYIIVFPADNLTLTSSIGNILKELCLHGMPICVVVTKIDCKTSEHEVMMERLKSDFDRYVNNEIVYCEACGKPDKANTKEVVTALEDIQKNAIEIIEAKYLNDVRKQLDLTKNYLTSLLKNSALSESELEEKEDSIKTQIESMQSKFVKAQSEYATEMEDCIIMIKQDIDVALQQNVSIFVTMLLSGQSINEKLNLIVRSACTESIKKRLIPKIEKYLDKIKNVVSGESIGEISVGVYCNVEEAGKDASAGVVAAIAAAILINPILGGLVYLVSKAFKGKKQEQQRQEAKAKVIAQLQGDVFPKVMDDVEKSLRSSIEKQAREMNASIESDFNEQSETLKKAMETIKGQRHEEEKQKQSEIKKNNTGLEKLGVLFHELQ